MSETLPNTQTEGYDTLSPDSKNIFDFLQNTDENVAAAATALRQVMLAPAKTITTGTFDPTTHLAAMAREKLSGEHLFTGEDPRATIIRFQLRIFLDTILKRATGGKLSTENLRAIAENAPRDEIKIILDRIATVAEYVALTHETRESLGNKSVAVERIE